MSVWRYLTADDVDAAEGLACDEAMMLHHGRAAEAHLPATLRLYTYRPHCALVGRYQALQSEVDLEYCERHSIQIGRRPTGGGAIIMGPGQLGVAIAAATRAEETPREGLKRYARGVIAGLSKLGIEARFRSKNDLEVEGRKIAGLGLYQDPHGAILFHASVLVDLDVELMLKVLQIPGAKFSDKAVERVEERVTTVSREIGRRLGAAELRDGFARAMAVSFGVELRPGDLDGAEIEAHDRLVAEKYASDEWVRQRSPQTDARGSSLLKTPDGLLRFFVGVHGDTIKNVLVTGDFNVLPVGIPRLEADLKWCRASPVKIRAIAAAALGEGDLAIPSEKVADAIWQAAAKAISRQEGAHPERPLGSCYFPEPGSEVEQALNQVATSAPTHLPEEL